MKEAKLVRFLPPILSVEPAMRLQPPLIICYAILSFLQPFLLLVLAQTNPSVTPINWDLYHSSDDLVEQIHSLVHRHPDKLSIETFKSGNKGYNAEVNVVTYCRGGRQSDDRSNFRILLTFGQHGRELITSELAFRILSILSEEQFLPNINGGATLNNTLLDKLVIKLVPIENFNGRKRVEAGDLCERRNGRGVDLNRNWGVDWGKKEKDYDPYEENPGTAPFSEPETQIMRKLALSFDPHIWINVHSGMEALFMPYDHKNTTPEGLPSQKMRSLLEKVDKLHCQNRCMIGSGGGSVGYLAHGTATDYIYDVVRTPMAFTFEIYGDNQTSSRDCFKMFNPVDLPTFKTLLNDWSAAFFTIFKMGPFHLDQNSTKAAEKWVSIDEYLDGYLVERKNRYGKNMEVIDVGMQEIKTYFRLFLLSSVLLMFMFCSRIAKSKYGRNSIPVVMQ